MHEYDTPASPVTLSSPSVCLNLDTLSSDGSAGPGDVSSHPISISDVLTQFGDRDQEPSDDETPQSVHVDLVTPTSRVQQFIQTCSPATATVTLSAPSSTPISPNRVFSDCTPGTLVPLPSGIMLMPVSCSALRECYQMLLLSYVIL